MSQVIRPAVKTQSNCHGNTEYTAAVVAAVAVGEGLREGKCVYVCVTPWCPGRPVESALTQKSLQLWEEKGSSVSRGLTHTHLHTETFCLLAKPTDLYTGHPQLSRHPPCDKMRGQVHCSVPWLRTDPMWKLLSHKDREHTAKCNLLKPAQISYNTKMPCWI